MKQGYAKLHPAVNVYGPEAMSTEAVPEPDTRPTPNDEQQRTFELAMQHRQLNIQYQELLIRYEASLVGMAHVLDALDVMEGKL